MRPFHFLLGSLSALLVCSALPTPLDLQAALNATARSTKGLTIPLTRHKRATASGKKILKTRDLGDVEVFDRGDDYGYLGMISIGSPPQEFQVLLDTGSTLLMVFGAEFFSSENFALDNSPRGPPFDPQKSSTFSYIKAELSDQPQSVSYQYADKSSFVAYLAQDTLSFGGYEVGNAAWSLGVQGNYSAGPGVSGILGLSWASINAGPNRYDQTYTVGLIEQLWRLGALEQPLYGLNLFTQKNAAPSLDSIAPGGHLTIGHLDDTLYDGEISYSPLVLDPNFSNEFPGSWTAQIDSFKVNGQVLPGSTLDVLFDNGNTVSHLPYSLLENVLSQIDTSQYPVYYSAEDKTWYFSCPENLPTPFESITLTFGGRDFDWPFAFLVQYITSTGDGNRLCTLSPRTASDGGPFIFGADFLRVFYSVFRFDPPSIGLANLKPGLIESENPKATNPLLIPTITNSDYSYLGLQTTPALYSPSPYPIQSAFKSVENETKWWNTNTQILPLTPTFLGDLPAPTGSPANQPSRGSGSQGTGDQKADGHPNGSSKLISSTVLLLATLASFALSTAILNF